MQHVLTLTVIAVYSLKRNIFKLDGHIGSGVRGEAEVISKAMTGVGYRRFVGIGIRMGGA
jgi:hypothetical protein